jgi:ER-bound oxygenase mpaB/B'/Rubber oxygenase, catalytic domain
MTKSVLADYVLEKLAHSTDPEAEEVVAKVIGELGLGGATSLEERRAAFPQLIRAIAHPEEKSDVDGFLRGGDEIAKKINPDLIDHAQEFFKRNGVAIITALFHAALPEAYLGERGVQVLDLTGGLVTNWTRRIHETGQFLINVLSPVPELSRISEMTSLSPGQEGAIKARRVRLIHAVVRWLLGAEEKRAFPHLLLSGFDTYTVWERRMVEIGKEVATPQGAAGPRPVVAGAPLNQEDLLATLGTFTTVTFEALDKLAIPFDDDDKEAYYHLWNVVGWHMGIGAESAIDIDIAGRKPWRKNKILPLSVKEMNHQYEYFRGHLLGGTEQGRRLAKALVQELTYPLPNAFNAAPSFLIRYFISDDLANKLEIEEGGYAQVLVRRSKALQWFAEELRSSRVGKVGVALMSDAVTRYALRTFVSQARTSEGGFAIGPQIASRWGIQVGPERSSTSI